MVEERNRKSGSMRQSVEEEEALKEEEAAEREDRVLLVPLSLCQPPQRI